MTSPRHLTVLVTGATGFIGRHTVDALLAAGHKVRALCRKARDPFPGRADVPHTAAVCVYPAMVKHAKKHVRGTSVKVASVATAFPSGQAPLKTRLAEVRAAVADGADEIDMVINVGKALGGDWDYVAADVKAVCDEAGKHGAKVKVIFENSYLKDEHKILLCEICGELGVDWVKTSTGYGSSGATIEDLVLMRKHSPANVQVKAAGGIRDLDALLQVIDVPVSHAGCDAVNVDLRPVPVTFCFADPFLNNRIVFSHTAPPRDPVLRG
jgi:deoxyribose-phosphate aldolase